VHDIFVGLPEQLTRYVEIGAFGPWLRTLTIGLAHLHLRRDVRRGRLLANKSLMNALSGATREPGTAIDVERAVASLPDRLRVVFVLKQWEGYAHDEIATMLNITPGTSRVRHLRALRVLRALLEP
ncbi:MAG: RNA polymerase sigma factor, partial [Gemmatimonadaceae bacterium]